MQLYFRVKLGEFAFKANNLSIDLIGGTVFVKTLPNNEVPYRFAGEIVLQPIKELPGGHSGKPRGNKAQRVTGSDSTFLGTVVDGKNTCDN